MTDLKILKEKLTRLCLKAMAQHLDLVVDQAAQKNSNLVTTFHRLVDHELEVRRQTAIALRYRQSHLIDKPTLDLFDFHHHKSRLDQKTQILNLFSLDFIAKGQNFRLIGNPGTGQTFLAKVSVAAAEADRSLVRKLHDYQTPDLLAIDEIGYLPLGPQGSNLFFQVISQRHEVKSTLLTTNLPFADWGNIFDSTTAATAIADRLVCNSEVLILGGSSYRKKIGS